MRVAIAGTTWHRVRVVVWCVGHDRLRDSALHCETTYWLLKGPFFFYIKSSNSKFVPQMQHVKCGQISVCQRQQATQNSMTSLIVTFVIRMSRLLITLHYMQLLEFAIDLTRSAASVTGYTQIEETQHTLR